MTERTKQLLEEIRRLPRSERDALIAEIVELADPVELECDPAWLAEIERRARDAVKDPTGATMDQVTKRFEERLRRAP